MSYEHNGCIECKYFSFADDGFPCNSCRYTAVPGSKDYIERSDFFEPAEAEEDSINHPSHYETGSFECIDVMRESLGLEDTKGFCLCNAFKYLYRCKKKHETPVEDVKKAIWYLNKFLELEGETNDQD